MSEREEEKNQKETQKKEKQTSREGKRKRNRKMDEDTMTEERQRGECEGDQRIKEREPLRLEPRHRERRGANWCLM